MRLFPDSLAARTLVLVVAVVLVAEAATFALIFQNRTSAHRHQIGRSIAGQIQMLQDILPGLDSATRRRLGESGMGEPGLQLQPDGPLIPAHQPQFGFAHELADNLAARLGEPVPMRHAGPGQRSGLWIGFLSGGERWWLVLPPPRFNPPGLPPDLWLWLAGALAVLLMIAGLFVCSIVGPLARLREAVSATGDGFACKVVPEGPDEVRQLAGRHNIMVDQLAQAESERREMLAGLTHDLRAPLARLRVRLALLGDEAERSGLKRDADDMEHIVNQCLGFLRADEGVLQPTPPLPIAEAASEMVARQSELGIPVRLSVSQEAAPALVAIPRASLQRLLDNLIDNAMHYGKPPVDISLAVSATGTLSLKVRDHGPGIPSGERARALVAFTQVSPERGTAGHCGLGLAIVRRIVVASRGTLELAEAPGGGLEVTMQFPMDSEARENLV